MIDLRTLYLSFICLQNIPKLDASYTNITNIQLYNTHAMYILFCIIHLHLKTLALYTFYGIVNNS